MNFKIVYPTYLNTICLVHIGFYGFILPSPGWDFFLQSWSLLEPNRPQTHRQAGIIGALTGIRSSGQQSPSALTCAAPVVVRMKGDRRAYPHI
jgi:hypothetical protein